MSKPQMWYGHTTWYRKLTTSTLHNKVVGFVALGALVLIPFFLTQSQVGKSCVTLQSTGSSPCEEVWEDRRKSYEAYIDLLSEKEAERSTTIAAWNGKRAYDMYEPEWVCDSEKRVGPGDINIGDGPKFVCGPDTLKQEKDCIVYSIGSRYDFSFEEGIRKYASNCEFHTFDGTMNLTKRALPADLEEKRIHFHNWNLDTASGTNEKGWVRKTIQEIVSELDHLGRTIQVFKIDCEGCEYGVIPQVIEKVRNGQLSIEQIHIEMHGTDAAKIQKIFQTMRSAGYAIFHKERNHWGCNGYSCVEYAFISMEQAKKIFKSTHCLRFQMIEDQEQLPEDCKSGELYGKQCSVWTNSREEVNVLPILYGGPFNQIIGMKSKLCLLRDYSGVLNLHIPPVQPHYSRSEDKPVDLRSHFDFKGMYHNLIFWNTSNEDFVFEKCIFLIDMPTISGDLTQRKPYFLRTSAIMLIRCVQEDVIQTSTADMTSVLKQHSLTNKRLANSLYIILGFHFGQDRCLVSLGPTLPHDGSKSFDSLKGYQRHNAEFLHAHDLIQPVFRCTMSEQRFVAVHLRVTDRVEDAGNSTHACLHLNGAKCDLDKTKLIKFRDIAESIEWISTDLGLVSVYLFSNQIEFVTTGLSPYMKLTNFVDDSCASLEPGWNQLACQFQAGCSATLFVGSPSSTISATLVIERSTKPSIFLHQLISIKNKRSA